MPLTIEDWKGIAETAEAAVTTASLLVGGVWVYLRYVRQQERYPNIEFSADVRLVGVQDGYWIAELIANIENKGKAQHRMEKFAFDLKIIEQGQSIETSERFDNQVLFPVLLAEGSFLPQRYKFFFIDPGLKAKYSYITRIPVTATFAILHCWFKYADGRDVGHTTECTVSIPSLGLDPKLRPHAASSTGSSRR